MKKTSRKSSCPLHFFNAQLTFTLSFQKGSFLHDGCYSDLLLVKFLGEFGDLVPHPFLFGAQVFLLIELASHLVRASRDVSSPSLTAQLQRVLGSQEYLWPMTAYF